MLRKLIKYLRITITEKLEMQKVVFTGRMFMKDSVSTAHINAVLSYSPYENWYKIVSEVKNSKKPSKDNFRLTAEPSTQLTRQLLAADTLFSPFGEVEESKSLLLETKSQLKFHNSDESNILNVFCNALEEYIFHSNFSSAFHLFMESLKLDKSNLYFCKRAQVMALLGGMNEKIIEPCLLIKDQGTISNEKFFPGMLSFAYEQLGDYKNAEKVASSAFERGINDTWLDHAFAHALYFQGPSRLQEGLDFLEQRTKSRSFSRTSLCNFLYSHVWWHYTLLLVESNNCSKALEIYDKVLFPYFSVEDNIELVEKGNEVSFLEDVQVQINAMELLWKVEARKISNGEEVSLMDRWEKLMDFVELKMMQHKDLLHSFLGLKGLYQTGKAKKTSMFIKSFQDSSFPPEVKRDFLDLCEVALEIYAGNEQSREKLKAMKSKWKVVGNSTEQRGIFIELSEGKPVVCGEVDKDFCP